MDSSFYEILDEWENGCFYNDEYLSEAYTNFLFLLMDASPQERQDPRVIEFIESGYQSYVREQGGNDPQAEETRNFALSMIGGGEPLDSPPSSPARPGSPCAPPPKGLWRPWTPSPGGKRDRSPSPEPEPEVEPESAPEVQPEIEIVQSRERYLRRFKTTFREEIAKIKGLGDSLPSDNLMEGMFDTLLARQREALQAKDDDRVILEIENARSTENPLWFNLRRVDQLNGRVILDKLSRVLNSNQTFMANGILKISYIHIPTPEAAGRNPLRVANESIEQWLQRKIKSATIFFSAKHRQSLPHTCCGGGHG